MTMTDTVDLLRALADETRLRLVALLADQGQLCVRELELALELPQYTVSRHLGMLRKARVVETERAGQRVCYRLRADLGRSARKLVARAVAATENDERRLRDRRRVRAARREGQAEG